MGGERRPHRITSRIECETTSGFDAWSVANRPRFKQRTAKHIFIMRDDGRRFPWGEPCACRLGPAVDEAPEVNRRRRAAGLDVGRTWSSSAEAAVGLKIERFSRPRSF